MLKELIQSFLPWILYSLLVGQTQKELNVAIIVAAITSIIFGYKGLKKGFILSWGTLAFFFFMLIAVTLLRNQWVAKHAWLFSNGTLAFIAWFSIAIRCPFTIQYAKEQVSQDKWQHPLFLKINYLLSGVWGFIFLAGLGFHVMSNYYPALSYFPSLLGIWFTTWFPNWYRAKYIREQGNFPL